MYVSWFQHIFGDEADSACCPPWGSPPPPGVPDLPVQKNDRITWSGWKGSGVSSFPIMTRRRKWILGGKRTDNGFLYVCLMTLLDKESPHPSPHSLKTLENVSNIKRRTLKFLVGGGVMNLGMNCVFLELWQNKQHYRGHCVDLTKLFQSSLGWNWKGFLALGKNMNSAVKYWLMYMGRSSINSFYWSQYQLSKITRHT